jgi:Na+-translocating ferredoxin:NAD+ oxidoreductase subunit C
MHKPFSGGIHPHDKKQATEDRPFEHMPPPGLLVLPLSQHLGRPALPLVKKGSLVRAGMRLAEASGLISAPIHAPVGGKVTSLGRHSSSGGIPLDAIRIETDPAMTETETLPPIDPLHVSPESIRERVREAGIVGHGGAAFPTAVKLTPPKECAIQLVILNGCECEPYLTRDQRLMIERPDEILSGLELTMRALHCVRGVIAIEDNKPAAISAMRKAAVDAPNVEVAVLPTRYPQGAEKMLIRAITGSEVPPGKLPPQVGIVVMNVYTVVAIHNAVTHGTPAITAALTVSGAGVREPKNLYVPVGTPIRAVIEYCGGMTETARRVVVGGPLMGVAQYDLDAPVLKATSGILVLDASEVTQETETACLHCGWCIDNCPMKLVPTRLVRLVRAHRYEEAAHASISLCMECGTCAYNCPAHIPLVQWLRLGKKRAAQIPREAKTP